MNRTIKTLHIVYTDWKQFTDDMLPLFDIFPGAKIMQELDQYTTEDGVVYGKIHIGYLNEADWEYAKTFPEVAALYEAGKVLKG